MSEVLRVEGGAAGVAAHLDDLDQVAGLLRRCGGDLAGLAAALGRVVTTPALQATVVTAPVSLAGVDRAAATALAGPGGLLATAGRLVALGTLLGLVVAEYRAADSAVDAALHQVGLAAGAMAGEIAAPVLLPSAAAVALRLGRDGGARSDGPGVVAPSVPASGGPAGQVGTGQVGAGQVGAGQVGAGQGPLAGWALGLLARHPALTERVVAAGPGFLNGLLRPFPGPIPGRVPVPGTGLAASGPLWDVPMAAAAAGRLGVVVPGLREPARIEVVTRGGGSVRPPRDLADVTARIAGCYPTDAAASGWGTVRVDMVRQRDGRRGWVVTIPGQQQLSLSGGTNPFDLAADVHAMAREDTAARRSVLAAMRSAGIPPGEPVLLAGHSQGGMIAAGLVADPALRSRYHITHVLTVGSPVAEYRVPDDVRVLSVEHAEDLVPRLDGRENPDRAGWVTVHRQTQPSGASPDVSTAHDLATYRHTVQLIDASADPSLRAWRSGLEPFLDGPGATARSIEVTTRRVLPRDGR